MPSFRGPTKDGKDPMADASHTNVRLRYTALMANHGTNRQQAPHWARVERERQIRPYKMTSLAYLGARQHN